MKWAPTLSFQSRSTVRQSRDARCWSTAGIDNAELCDNNASGGGLHDADEIQYLWIVVLEVIRTEVKKFVVVALQKW